jgi:DNA-binding SARP family transcriptional activator
MEFAVLGEVRASRAGQPIALGGPQQRRLLAVLLSNTPRSVALERIIEVMWDDPPPDGARRTTMSYISRLRGALGTDRVDLVNTGYRLVVADSEVDAIRFERLVEQSRVAPPTEAITLLDQALGLWQGPCFGEFSSSWWAIPMASRLEEMRLSAEEERIDVLLAIDRIEQAMAQLELLTAAHPLRPGFTERFMRASAIAGREAEALRAMSTYRSRSPGGARRARTVDLVREVSGS